MSRADALSNNTFSTRNNMFKRVQRAKPGDTEEQTQLQTDKTHMFLFGERKQRSTHTLACPIHYKPYTEFCLVCFRPICADCKAECGYHETMSLISFISGVSPVNIPFVRQLLEAKPNLFVLTRDLIGCKRKQLEKLITDANAELLSATKTFDRMEITIKYLKSVMNTLYRHTVENAPMLILNETKTIGFLEFQLSQVDVIASSLRVLSSQDAAFKEEVSFLENFMSECKKMISYISLADILDLNTNNSSLVEALTRIDKRLNAIYLKTSNSVNTIQQTLKRYQLFSTQYNVKYSLSFALDGLLTGPDGKSTSPELSPTLDLFEETMPLLFKNDSEQPGLRQGSYHYSTTQSSGAAAPQRTLRKEPDVMLLFVLSYLFGEIISSLALESRRESKLPFATVPRRVIPAHKTVSDAAHYEAFFGARYMFYVQQALACKKEYKYEIPSNSNPNDVVRISMSDAYDVPLERFGEEKVICNVSANGVFAYYDRYDGRGLVSFTDLYTGLTRNVLGLENWTTPVFHDDKIELFVSGNNNNRTIVEPELMGVSLSAPEINISQITKDGIATAPKLPVSVRLPEKTDNIYNWIDACRVSSTNCIYYRNYIKKNKKQLRVLDLRTKNIGVLCSRNALCVLSTTGINIPGCTCVYCEGRTNNMKETRASDFVYAVTVMRENEREDKEPSTGKQVKARKPARTQSQPHGHAARPEWSLKTHSMGTLAIPSSVAPDNLDHMLVMDGASCYINGKEFVPVVPVRFADVQGVVRLYKDVFLVLDTTSNSWKCVRITIH